MNSEPQMSTSVDGTKKWLLHGKLHRIGAPAVECANGTKAWCINGKLHRIEGPAIEWADGSRSWFVNNIEHCDVDQWAIAALQCEGIECTKENVEQKIQCAMQCDLF